jgi:endonuclease YncB( thermonuclease family)
MNRILTGLVGILAVIAIVSLASCGQGARYIATDGDTIRAPNGERIRLLYIDAPEMPGSPRDCRRANCPAGDPFVAQDALQRALDTAPVSCIGNERDRYGRRLAECFLISPGGTRVSINDWMLSTGTVQRYERNR